jgi:hypothetical protein
MREIKSFEIKYTDINGNVDIVVIDKYPDTCPVCKVGVEAKPIHAYGKSFSDYREGHMVQFVFQCPRLDCQAVFIAYYLTPDGVGYRSNNYVFLKRSFVQPYFKLEEFEKEIKTLSPDFVEIYTQAKLSEETGLNLICGSGYRKALEFLIKDFLIKYTKKDSEYVKGHKLGWLIAKDVSYERIKITANLAKDLGNDETHYEKKVEELNIEDMKKLIVLTCHWITDVILTDGYNSKGTRTGVNSRNGS